MKKIHLLGPGNVGREFLNQTISIINNGTKIYIQSISDSRTTLFKQTGFSPVDIELICKQKNNKKQLSNLEQFRQIKTLNTIIDENSIIVDCSATHETIPLLLDAIEKKASIVLANKIPLTYDISNAGKIMQYDKTRYEATVGAGLPVIASLKRIIQSGDEIKEIFGLVSGTLGFVCSEMDKGKNYSEIIKNAYELGYTEPDPRDDLGGMDAARKAVILGKTCGWDISMDDSLIEPLYNPETKELDIPAFMDSLEKENEHYETLATLAMSKNEVLRYLIYVNPEKATAKLHSIPSQSAFGTLQGAENRIEFHSKIFNLPPLAICGAGAGTENTALGILTDVLDLL